MRWGLGVGCALAIAATAAPLAIQPVSLPAPVAPTEPTPTPSAALDPIPLPLPTAAAFDPDGFEEVAVDGDLPVYVARPLPSAAPARMAVFLTGSCTHPLAYIHAFHRATRAHGGLVALQGDEPCKADPTLRRWSPDTVATSARIDAALHAAGVTDTTDLTLIGYSQGAERAEWLARRFPVKYTRFVLMAGPVVPAPARFADARAVATMAGHGDVRENMADGARRLRRASIPASYFELPGIQHGELSLAVDDVVARALDWLEVSATETTSRPGSPHARGARSHHAHTR